MTTPNTSTLVKSTANSAKQQNKTPIVDKPETAVERIARVNGMVDSAIKSSANHASVLLDALCETMLLAADVDIGNYEPLNRLWNNISVGDNAAIFAWTKRFLATDGFHFKTVDDNGKEKLNTFYKFTVKGGFVAYPAEKGSDNHKLIVAIRNRVTEAGIDTLRRIGFGNGSETARAMETVFNADDTARKFLSTLIRNGMKSQAFALQRAMAEVKIQVPKAGLEKLANDLDPDKRIARATKQLARAQEIKNRMTAN